MAPKINRRDFVKLAGVAGAAAIVACRTPTLDREMEEKVMSLHLEGQNGKRYLVAYSSKYGSTAGIAEAVGKACHTTSVSVDVLPVSQVDSLSGYDGALIGSAIYVGAWRKDALEMIESNQAALQEMPVAYFAGCLTMATEDPEQIATALTYCNQPAEIVPPASEPGIFAGKIDRGELNLVDKLIITAMRAPLGDHRPWEDIHQWALRAVKQF